MPEIVFKSANEVTILDTINNFYYSIFEIYKIWETVKLNNQISVKFPRYCFIKNCNFTRIYLWIIGLIIFLVNFEIGKILIDSILFVKNCWNRTQFRKESVGFGILEITILFDKTNLLNKGYKMQNKVIFEDNFWFLIESSKIIWQLFTQTANNLSMVWQNGKIFEQTFASFPIIEGKN